VILGTFGASDRFADIPRAPKLSLTSFFVMIYTSSRWLDGRIGAKIRPRPAPSKTNFFFYDDVMHVILYLNSRADVFRVLLQYAQRIQSKRFDTVQLAYKGKTNFFSMEIIFKKQEKNMIFKIQCTT